MSHDDIRAVRSFLRRREVIGHRSIDGAKIRAIKASLRNQCHVMGCREMLCVVEPARIHEIRVGAAKLLCTPIHLLRKRGNGTRDVLGEPVCDLVRGFQHKSVETVTHLNAISLCHFQIDSAGFQILRRSTREHHSVILRRILQYQKRRHKFGDGSGIVLVVCILLIQELSAGRVVEHSALRSNFRCVRRLCASRRRGAEQQHDHSQQTGPQAFDSLRHGRIPPFRVSFLNVILSFFF